MVIAVAANIKAFLFIVLFLIGDSVTGEWVARTATGHLDESASECVQIVLDFPDPETKRAARKQPFLVSLCD
jgi:hypothetical protein